MTDIKVGFIGLGNMGMSMAKTLVKKGVPLIVYDLRKEPVEEMKALGATAASSCREVAAASEIVISMVRDIPETDEVIFGKDGVWEGIKEGGIIIISSTLNPTYCKGLYAKAKERGVRVIDCPVSGNDPAAEDRGLTLMIGGDEDAVKQCWLVFEAMGKNIFYLGDIGTGQAYKLVNNTVALCAGTLVREALNLGIKAGLDLQKMVDVMRVSSGSTWGIQNWGKMRQLRRPMLQGPPPTAKPPQNLGIKDLEMAFELAKESGAQMPIAQFIAKLDTRSLYAAVASVHILSVGNR